MTTLERLDRAELEWWIAERRQRLRARRSAPTAPLAVTKNAKPGTLYRGPWLGGAWAESRVTERQG